MAAQQAPTTIEEAGRIVPARAPAGRSAAHRTLEAMSKYGTVVALVAMIAVFSLSAPETFPTPSNLVNILNQVALTGIIACGLTVALVVGEYDLSIGYVASFAGVLVTGFMGMQHMGTLPAVLAVLAICAAVGLVNGLIVTKLGVHSFIATLGTGTIVVGLNFAYNSGAAVALTLPRGFLDFSLDTVASIPLPVFVTAAVALVLWVVLNRTVFGQSAQAVGGNAEAARLAGVRVDRVRIGALVVSATCAGAGGILLASKLGSGQTTAGDGFLLDAFAAAFLGSVALRDGEFHVVGTIIGVLTVGVGFSGLAILDVPTFWQYLFKGGLLILAVAMSTLARRLVRA